MVLAVVQGHEMNHLEQEVRSLKQGFNNSAVLKENKRSMLSHSKQEAGYFPLEHKRHKKALGARLSKKKMCKGKETTSDLEQKFLSFEN